MKKHQIFSILSIFVTLTFLVQCAEEPQKSLWELDPNYEVKQNPVVTAVEPQSAYAGITQVTIHGDNFDPSDNFSHTRVYFGGEKAQLLSITGDSIITCITPVVLGDSLLIKVQVDGALLFGVSEPYKVESAQQEYGGITGAYDAYGMAVDLNENLFLSLGDGRVIYVTPEEEIKEFDTLKVFFRTMKMGPNNTLHGGRTIYIYRMTETGYDSLRLSRPLNDFDFDENLNIFYSTRFALYTVNQAGSDRLVADYPSYVVSSLRVYNGYVYVSATYTGTDTTLVQRGIWRNEILNATGDLGSNELVFDWRRYFPAGAAGIPSILSMTFGEDGDLYIGSDSTQISNAITVIHPDGEGNYLPENVEPLYASVLMPPATVMSWGTGQYMYVNRRSINNTLKRVIRVTMGKNSAPYYGRQ
ncbi:MAG: IPT/TIG domain-containing protein [bacterium]|nr:MAG: IPT/TIG domain-containing protein [bacterium]